jgi:Rieske Fe-S protein
MLRHVGYLVVAAALSGCAPSDRQAETVAIDVSELHEGQYVRAEWNNVPIVVYRQTAQDLLNLNALSEHVFVEAGAGDLSLRSQREGFFVGVMVSPYSRCVVLYAPPKEDGSWLGGFNCPCRNIPYDLAGRTIRPGQYSPSGWAEPSAYLEIPPHHFEGDTLVIGE